MKLALLSFEYPPETDFGGIGTYTWHQARGLANLGHEVHVLAGDTNPTDGLEGVERDGVSVWRFRSAGAAMRAAGAVGRWRLWWTKNRLQNAISMWEGLRRLRDRHNFDLIEMPECGAEGMLINHLTSCNTLVRFHSPAQLIMGFSEVVPADCTFAPLVEQLGVMGAGHYSACSHFMARAVRREMAVMADVPVIPNGIDLDWFDATPEVDIRRSHDLPRGKPIVLFAARMERRKGIETCAEVASRILETHDVAFVFAGRDIDGYLADTLLPRLRRRPLVGSVHYIGQLGLDAMRSCLHQSDVILLPSLWENCPYACLEAMAAGRAIVSSDAGGLPELIEDGVNGFLAPAGNAGAFVSKIVELVEAPTLRDRLGAAARSTVERRFHATDIARRSAELYAACINGG